MVVRARVGVASVDDTFCRTPRRGSVCFVSFARRRQRPRRGGLGESSRGEDAASRGERGESLGTVERFAFAAREGACGGDRGGGHGEALADASRGRLRETSVGCVSARRAVGVAPPGASRRVRAARLALGESGEA